MIRGISTALLFALAALCAVVLANTQEQQPQQQASTSLTLDTETPQQHDQRSSHVHCDTCELCNLADLGCQDLASQVCAAITGTSDQGYETDLIGRGTVKNLHAGYWFLFDLNTCYQPFSQACSPGTINVTMPSIPSCQPWVRNGDDLVLALAQVSLTGARTAYLTTCKFNKPYSQLTNFDMYMLGVTDAAPACYPWVISELGVYTTPNYIELYNPSPVPRRVSGYQIWFNGALLVTLTGGADPIPSGGFLLISKTAFPTTTASYSLVLSGLNFNPSSSAYLIELKAPQYSNPSSLITLDSINWDTTAGFPAPWTNYGAQLNNNWEHAQYPPGVPRYNVTQSAIGSEWSLCLSVTVYANEGTCTPGYLNFETVFAFGKRDVEERASIKCMLHHSAGLAYPQDFCTSKLFYPAREALVHAYPVLSRPDTFTNIAYSTEVLRSLTSATDMLVLGDPIVETLTSADLDALYQYVKTKGGSLFANVNSQGEGALALVNRLLGRQNRFSTNTADCKAVTSMNVAQTSFIEDSEKKVLEYLNSCHTGLTCNGGVSLAKDYSLIPVSAQTTLCYAEVGLGRVFFVTSWNAFMLSHGMLEKSNNKQLLLNWMQSSLLL